MNLVHTIQCVFQIPCRRRLVFNPTASFSDETSLATLFYRYFHGEWTEEVSSRVGPVLTFTANTHHATHIVASQRHSLHIPLLRCRFQLLPINHLPCRTESQEIASSISKILIFSSPGWNVIFHTYLHRMCHLLSNPLQRVALKPCTRVNTTLNKIAWWI